MAETALTAEPRTVAGSRACRRLRASGLTPAVVYGHKEGAVSIQIKNDDIVRMVREGHKVVDLDLSGDHEKALIRDLQWDTWSKEVIHVDFLRVSKGELMEVELPLEFVGEAIGTQNGGVLEHPNVSITVECPALQIPDAIRVNLSDLKIGESLTVGELTVPDQVKVLTEPDVPVATIVDPAAIAAAVEAENAASDSMPAEPEVIDATGGDDADGGDDGADTAVVN